MGDYACRLFPSPVQVRCCYKRWWINRPALCKPTSGQFSVMRQSRHAFPSPHETPSELLCGCLHPSPHDMRQPPIWLVSLSSGKRRQRASEHLTNCPSSGGSAGCHRRSPLTVALRHQLASALLCLHERHSQCSVRTDKMIVGSPLLQMGEQGWRLLCGGPGAAGKGCYPMADGQIYPLDESGVQSSREA